MSKWDLIYDHSDYTRPTIARNIGLVELLNRRCEGCSFNLQCDCDEYFFEEEEFYVTQRSSSNSPPELPIFP